MARDEQPLGEREAGGSIAVPNVQQLASVSKDDHVLPIRYIRPELELDQLSIDGSHQVPVIDMIKLAADDEESAKLHSACKDWGFFQVINHGVTEEVIQRMKLDLQVFFNQPLEEKMSCAQLPNGLEGYGQAFVVSEEQKLDWGDMLFILSLPVNGRNMRFWPKVPSSFRASFEQYSSDLEKLALNLLSYMAKNLGLEPEKLLTRFEEGFQSIRMNYYPPCKESNKVMGLTPHSDATGLTLLTQVNDVQGLQIKRDGKWVPIVPIPGAFIVNVGDIIEMMSNGEYRSIEHRAVVNPEKERMSIAAFHSPNMKAMLGPIPDLINEKKQAKYQSVLPEEFMKLVVSSKLDGKVPNVQQLASESKDDHVPIRYIRPELDLDQVSTDGSHQVPVIDMIKLASVGEDADEESSKLHSACRDWGFFQVINHGITEEVIQNMKVDLQVFFNQPLQEKMSCAQLPNGLEGYGQAFVVSEEQKLDWGDMLFVHAQPVNGRNLRFWPKVPSSFKASFEQYSSELEKLALSLLSYMAKNLGLEPEKLLTLFEEGFQSIRMNYYPPCKEFNKVMGLTPHSDAVGLTLLTQVNDVQGLQIRKGGKWVPIEPISGAFIVNVGDIIEMMSNGEYKSIEHRAVVNPEKERLSMAAFHSPNMKAMLGPIPELINEKKPVKYQSVSPEEFMKLVVSSKLDGKGLLSQLMINE
ncbi:2-oxoglutarate-dependent dioxygenase 11 [Linum perenne]